MTTRGAAPGRGGRSRVPAAVGSIPLVGDLARSLDTQTQWVQDLVEQNARLVGQLPATLKSFNDSLERFNQTVGRLDRAVGRLETTTRTLTAPLERVSGALDPRTLRDLPDTLDTLRRETVPALRAAADTQRQVAVLQSTLERITALVADLPGGGLVRRLATPAARPPAGPPEG